MKLSVIIPVYNECESIADFVQELLDIYKNDSSVEVIFVNDGSTDNTLSILEKDINNISGWKIINLYRNYGKSIALQAGFDIAQGSIVATIDGDLQDNPREIKNLINHLNKGHDLVCGWKKSRKDSLEKRLASSVFNFFVRLFSGLKVHDSNCGIKVFRKEVVGSLNLYGGRHRYIPLLAHQKNFSTSELVVDHRERKFGVSKYGKKRYSEGFFDFLTILFLGKYMDRPLHFFGAMGLFFSVAGIIVECYVLYLKYFLFEPFQKHIALLIFGAILIIAGLQLFTFGLLGELIVNKKQKVQKYIKEIIE